MSVQIAIDGPSGAGKSSLSRKVAEKLGYVYIDTGAMYRTIGLYVKRRGIGPKEENQVKELLGEIHLDVRHVAGVQHIFLNGEDVSEEIRRHEISQYASDVSTLPSVRAFLLDYQRQLAQSNNVIMDGRDIGTVVLPGATVKIFLTADPRDRAKRRYRELCAKGSSVDFEKVYQDILERDRQDSSRAAAPLKPAPDAILLDTTGNEFEESVRQILEIIKGRL